MSSEIIIYYHRVDSNYKPSWSTDNLASGWNSGIYLDDILIDKTVVDKVYKLTIKVEAI